MKIIFLTMIIMVSIQNLLGQKTASNSQILRDSEIETIDFCELVSKRNDVERKKVRTAAIFAYGGEDFSVLYCPQCYKGNNTLQPIFTEMFETLSKPKVVSQLSRQKRPSGSFVVTLIGTLSGHQFLIDYVERARYISKDYYFPDRLSIEVNRRTKCKENE